MSLVGLVAHYDSGSPNGIPDQWLRFMPLIRGISGQVGRTTYGVSFNFDRASNFDYMSGVEVDGARTPPIGMTSLLLPAQKYAVFRHPGHIAGVRSTFAAILGDWFPRSGYKAANAPNFERYGAEFNPTTGRGGFEIWIPVNK
jgi:AraC family transcriptional regulator